jgi:hypothetical protein
MRNSFDDAYENAFMPGNASVFGGKYILVKNLGQQQPPYEYTCTRIARGAPEERGFSTRGRRPPQKERPVDATSINFRRK